MNESSRAWIVDLAHSIGEKLALCDHLAEKLDDKDAKELYNKVLQERRNEMRLLVKYAPNPNTEWWCGFKHALKSWVLAMEVYDNLPSEEMFNVAQYNADILAGIMSKFLGVEFKICERCLNDLLLAKYNETRKDFKK